MTEKTIRRYCRAVGSYLPGGRSGSFCGICASGWRNTAMSIRTRHRRRSASERRSRWRQAMWMTWIPQSCCRPCVTGGV